jgi:hypothetical protein
VNDEQVKPKCVNHKRIRLVREDAIGITLGGTEYVLDLKEARAVGAELQSEAFFASEMQALRREVGQLRDVLREVRRDIEESADDVVWMRGGIETVCDRIAAALGETEGASRDGQQ